MFTNRCFDMPNPGFDAKMPAGDTQEMKASNMNVEMGGYCGQPVYECPQERCCHRQIHHEVKHIVPVNTRIMNHHIIHHSYVPMYTCCEENDCCNVYDNNCM